MSTMRHESLASLLVENARLVDLLRPFAGCSFPDSRDDSSVAISTMTGNALCGDFRAAGAAVRAADLGQSLHADG